MSSSKLHHYVPRFYLRGFHDREHPRSTWVYEKGTALPRLQGIANTAAETYYYTINTPAGERRSFLESKYLAPIEAAAAPIVEQLRTEPRPIVTPEQVEPLASFLTALFARSPLARRAAEKFFLGLATAQTKRHFRSDRAIDEFLETHPDIPLSADEVRRLVAGIDDPSRWRLGLKRDLAVALQFAHVARFYPYLRDKTMSVLEGAGDPEFLTCDSPLSVFTLSRRGRALVGVGIGQPNAEVVLPLCPTRALRLAYRQQPVRQRVSVAVVRDINRRIIYQAQRYVYASRKSKRIGAFVAKWFEEREEFKVDPRAMAAYAERFARTRRSRRP
jgi:hypothetical protein